MSDQKSGGSGPFLTKDEFYQWKDEYHLDQMDLRDRMDAQTKEITAHFDDGVAGGRAHCEKADLRLERRIEKLENNTTWERLIAGGVAFGTAILTAVASWWALARGG
jgi:hypothetical protein